MRTACRWVRSEEETVPAIISVSESGSVPARRPSRSSCPLMPDDTRIHRAVESYCWRVPVTNPNSTAMKTRKNSPSPVASVPGSAGMREKTMPITGNTRAENRVVDSRGSRIQ